ncbi:hypothetical protein HK405_007908, partial [Cladochytrium tenue]
VNYFPDGGVARLRVYGRVIKDWTREHDSSANVDLLALENGGVPVAVTNSHYGTPFNLIRFGDAEGMYDGWETARNPNRPPVFERGPDGLLVLPGHESCAFALGHPAASIAQVHIDTSHFKGNCPESARVEAASWTSPPASDPGAKPPSPPDSAWSPLIPRTRLTPHTRHDFPVASTALTGPVTHLRLTIFPDGGVARLRAFGRPALPAPATGTAAAAPAAAATKRKTNADGDSATPAKRR